MKILLALLLTFASLAQAAETCSESTYDSTKSVTYEVNKGMPNYLKGATITVKLADGTESTVPAEKFMVVPRKQKTVLGESKESRTVKSCKEAAKKNTVFADVRNDYKGLSTKSDGKTATIESQKGLTPGLNYYRHELLDTPVGAGVGVDTNGTVKGMIGIDF